MNPGNGNGQGNGNPNDNIDAAEAQETYSTELLLNGFSVLGNAAKSNAPAANGGRLRIHDGTDVFEADDVVVFLVENVTVDGVLTDDSVITGIIVYDNVVDYYNGVELYSYSGTADIDVGRRTMGDRYLEFEADNLVSDDPNAPLLEELTLVPGVDIRAALETSSFLDIETFENIDLDGDGEISEDEAGDGAFSDDLNELFVVCFAKGTLIETPQGPTYIEALREGDMVITLDDGPQPIRWIGTQKISGQGRTAPVHIKAGALGNLRELVVSQNHRVLLSGPKAELLFGASEVLVAAKHLVNDDSIRIIPHAEIEYVHFLFDSHQIVFAEGCPAESLYPGAQTLDVVSDDSRDEIISLFPELIDQSFDSPLSRYTLCKFEAQALRAFA